MLWRILRIVGLLLVFLPTTHADMLLPFGSTWRYFKGTNEATRPTTSAWRAASFNDNAWLTGAAPLYYGEALTGTELTDMPGRYRCVFLRKRFVLTNLTETTSLDLRAQCDDGFVAWINGAEVFRYNLPAGTVTFTNAVTANLETTFVEATLTNVESFLVNGTNVLAVQAFTHPAGTNDFVIDVELASSAPDTIAPAVATVTPAPGTITNLTQFTVVFGEPVRGVKASDLLVNGQPASNVVSAVDTYTFRFPQPPYGPVAVAWSAGATITDYAQPPNSFDPAGPGTTWPYTLIDRTPPFLVEVLPPTNTAVSRLDHIEVIFSEPVDGVDAADLLINGAAATNMLFLAPGQYLFEFPPAPIGQVTVAWNPAHGITDLAAATNRFGGGSWSYMLDTNPPPNSVIISEFLASNNRTLLDEDNDTPDWIELHNATDLPVNLGGWFLTDEASRLTKWTIPGVVLLPRGYLVVFASNKNRTNVTGRLHTNFQLANGGEFLALVDPATNLVSAFAPTYPPQQTDVSYGRDRLAPGLSGYFTRPTPGAPNANYGAGFGPEVQFSRQGGTYINPFELSLSTGVTNAIIRYVLVNTAASAAATNVPATNSPIYSGPIPVSGAVQVRARAFVPGLLPGPPRSETYIPITVNAANFSSDLPLVLIHNFGAGAYAGGTDRSSYVAFFDRDPVTGRASLVGRPDADGRAGVNLRGSSTEGYPKSSFAVEYWDEYNEDNNVAVLGMPAESDWVLYAPNYFDQVLIHNPFIYDLSNDVGRYGSRTRLVEVFVNTSGGAIAYTPPVGGNYNGVYVLEEKIKRSPDRVDIEELYPEQTNAPAVTGGYLLKIDRADPDERTFATPSVGSIPSVTIVYQYPDGIDLETPQRDPQEQYIRAFFARFATNLASAGFTNPVTGYRSFIDVDSWIDHHILNVLTINADAFRLSGYFFKGRNRKLEMGPIWDFDRSLGTGNPANNDYRPFSPRSWMGAAPLGGGTDFGTDFFNANNVFANPWYPRLFTDPDFWQRWIDRYQEWRAGHFAVSNLQARVDALGARLREAQVREVARWRNQGNSDTSPRNGRIFAAGYTNVFDGTYQGELNFLKRWLADRIEFIDTNFLSPPQFSTNSALVPPGYPLTLIGPAKAGTRLYYTLDGSDPRAPGGGISPTALLYSNALPITWNTYVVSRAYNPNHRNLTGAGRPPISSPWSGLSAGTFMLEVPALVITEIMYHPDDPPSGNTNEAGNFEYIELKNVGSAPLNLIGFRLTNGIDFLFTATNAITQLAPGAYVLVVRNQAAFQSRYPGVTNIAGEFLGSLANEGERMVLEGPARERILDFRYNDLWYRLTDGPGFSLVIRDETAPLDTWGTNVSWRPSAAYRGSPGQADSAPLAIAPIVVNEALSASVPPDVDAIELHNPTTNDVNISGWFLSDDFQVPRKFRVPDGTLLRAGGFVVFTEAQFNRPGDPNGFALSSRGDEVYVFSGDGAVLTGYFHGFDFGDAEAGVSFGRHLISTGDERFVPQAAQTLTATNAGPKVGPVVFSEIMYHPRDFYIGSNRLENVHDEYVELRNLTDQPVPLYDTNYPANTWKVTAGVDYTFPPGVALPPRGSLLVVNFDPRPSEAEAAAFRRQFGFPDDTPLFGPFLHRLGDEDDTLELRRPGTPILPPSPDAGLVPYIRMEKIDYSAASPWPTNANGTGAAIRRLSLTGYANDPTNWVTALVMRPTISLGPVPATVRPGSNATFTVTATGTGTLRYQWRHNGVDIPAATNSSLALSNVQVAQVGLYDVQVSDVVGATPSAPALLRLLIDPVIVVQPQHITAVTGSTVTLTVTVTNTATLPIGYRWRRTGTTVTNFVVSSYTSALTLTNLSGSHAGAYTIVVTNASFFNPGSLSSNAYVVAVAPPSDQVAGVGSNVVFRVDAFGTTPTFQWFFNELPISSETNNTLALTNVQLTHEGAYSVNVINAAREATRFGARLILDSDRDGLPDAWERAHGLSPNNPADAALDSDGDGMSNADEYVAGTDPLDARSYLRVDLEWDGHARLQFLARSNRTYTIQFKESFERGRWTRITDVDAHPTNRLAIVVDPYPTTLERLYRLVTPQLPAPAKPEPIVLQSPQPARITLGDDLTLEVIAAGQEPLAYRWLWGATSIPGANQVSLLLTNLQPAAAGHYAVTVSDPQGSITTEAARVGIRPRILQSPQSQTIAVGQPATFSVTATGAPPLRYRWYRDLQPLPGQTNATLVILNVRAEDAGNYRVIVGHQTPIGAESASSEPAVLTVTP